MTDAAQETFVGATVMARPVRLAYGLGPLIAMLDEAGVPVDRLLAQAEIPRFALDEPSFEISLAQEVAFTEASVAALGRDDAGLVLGQRYHVAMFGVLGLAAASAPSMEEFMKTMLAYPELAWGVFEIGVWRDADTVTMRLDESTELGASAGFFAVRDMACSLTIFRDAVGMRTQPVGVRFRRSRPADTGPYDAFFGCTVEFEAANDEMVYDASVWETRPVQADPTAHRFFAHQCRRLCDSMERPFAYADIVRARLRAATPMPALPEIAASLHMTERTLQRRLADEGVRFSELLKAVRLERARDLLAREALLVEDIAYRLGFRDAVAFSRAFKAWTGVSPSEHRRLAAGSAPEIKGDIG